MAEKGSEDDSRAGVDKGAKVQRRPEKYGVEHAIPPPPRPGKFGVEPMKPPPPPPQKAKPTKGK